MRILYNFFWVVMVTLRIFAKPALLTIVIVIIKIVLILKSNYNI